MQQADAFTRRAFLGATLACSGAALAPPLVFATSTTPIRRRLPGRDESLPAIGMGSWLTFDVGDDPDALATRLQVLRTFFDAGGALIDSSPMYMTSEHTIGWCLKRLDDAPVFAATKVWDMGARRGIAQMQRSGELWGTPRFDLMQVHNLLDWGAHLDTLRRWRDEGRIRYIGMTTSHGRRHREMARIIRDEPDVDVVQFTYNIADRDAEDRLLPLALEHGKGVIINRPFQGGRLVKKTRGRPLPGFAAEIGCESWPQYLLKFVVSHPAVTCAIPATSRVDHMAENMVACRGELPDERLRARMVAYFESL